MSSDTQVGQTGARFGGQPRRKASAGKKNTEDTAGADADGAGVVG